MGKINSARPNKHKLNSITITHQKGDVLEYMNQMTAYPETAEN